MKTLARYALSIGGAAVLLAGCGALQPSMPPTTGAGEAVRPPTRNPFETLYSFKGGENGLEPFGALLQVSGVFYGATGLGGNPECYGKAFGCGTLYTVTSRGQQHVLYRFRRPGGVNPEGSLIHVAGSLYGLTGGGGPARSGTVFEISASGKERTLYSFKGVDQRHTDGQQPQGGLRYLNGKLYGVTFGGRAYHSGTIFELNLAGKERVLHFFKGDRGKDGATPQAGLIDVNGTLYGTTSTGGGVDVQACSAAFGNSCGTVFSIASAGQYHVLYRFRGKRDGAYPLAGLMYFNGELYGTTYFGGAVGSGCPAGCGTVFQVNPTTGQEHVIYRFKGGADGYQPGAALLAYRGALYGSTYLGGVGEGCSVSGFGGCGTIFEITTSGKKSILWNFGNGSGLPNSPFVEANGNLYSTTPLGGPYCRPILGCGTFFRLKV